VRSRGYTLIELLIALGIIALVAGMVTLSLPRGEERRVREEAARLGALFRIAQDQARIAGRVLVWQADLEGYAFRLLDADPAVPWQDETLRPRSWPFAVQRLEAQPILFTREPLLSPARVRIATASSEVLISLDALGKVAVQDCGTQPCAASR
jgi:general secretion pathway protein H